VANLSVAVTRVARVPTRSAHLAGLFHDVGLAAGLVALSERYRGRPPPLDRVLPAALETHADGSAVVARLCGLDADLELVLLHHPYDRIAGIQPALLAIVALSEALANARGLDAGEAARDAGWAVEVLRLGPLFDDVQREADAICALVAADQV
jgi:hypothetical protein